MTVNIEEAINELLKSGLTKQHLESYLRTYDTRGNMDGFRATTREMADVYERKNRDYGSAFDISLDADGLLVSKIRMQDKLNRFASLIKNDAMVKDESIRDTLMDLANYAIMTIMWMDLTKRPEETTNLTNSNSIVEFFKGDKVEIVHGFNHVGESSIIEKTSINTINGMRSYKLKGFDGWWPQSSLILSERSADI